MSIRRTLSLAALALAGALPLTAQSGKAADEGRWLVRLRALSLTPANQSDPIPSLRVPPDAITVSSKVFPEVDVTYFLTPNFAAELVLTYPQRHDVELSGTKIGTFRHLPPTLLAQWHFLPTGTVRPYVGAGVNLTLISDVNLAVPNVGALDLGSSSVGVAAQAGVDVRVAPKWFVNADAKYVTIGTDVTLRSSGAKVSAVGVNPFLLSLGLGYRF